MVIPGSIGFLSLLVLVMSACAYVPAGRERAQAEQILREQDGVVEVELTCGGTVLASDSLCADVYFNDGTTLRFDRIGFRAFGATAVNIFVAGAGSLVPRIASCDGVGPPNFHREGPLGHHFAPTLIDVKEAVNRHREVLEEIQYWPECPQHWEVQDKRGNNYRYCARKKAATEEPPRPAACRAN
jgi:hypothetical protein